MNILERIPVLPDTRPLEVEELPGGMADVAQLVGVIMAVEDDKAAVPGDGCS